MPSKGPNEASNTVEHFLRDKQLEMCELLKCEIYDPKLWEHTIQFSQIEKAAEAAKNLGKPKFALFISSESMNFVEDKESYNEIEWD
ncbi:hypothetical protein [Microbulbifer variabilis]|uniref:hypothetical protein n=1 Tax=Microbulbifer variabilis TaxID=266805 RepID=UPI001CFE8873|nr:hypothetical protein [Microbulbifer variabilis]